MRVSWRNVLVAVAVVAMVFVLAIWFLPVLVPVALIIALLALVYLGVRSLAGHPPTQQL